MSDEKGLLNRIGSAFEAAKDKAQEMGASIAKEAKVVAADTKRQVDKATSTVAKSAASAKQ